LLKNDKKTGVLDGTWNFFASLKLAIVLLLLLAVTSIIGTVIQQNVEPAKNIAFLAGIFGDNAAPTVYNIFIKLDFMDMYHSWWFVTILVLFCINLTVCSLEKFPKTWKVVKAPIRPLAENVIRTLPIKKEFTLNSSLDTVKDDLMNSLRSSKYRVLEATEESSGVQLYTQKGAYTRLGVYLVHLSILLIFVGAIIGLKYGFDGSLNIPEGKGYPFIYLPTGPLTEAERLEKNSILNSLYATKEVAPAAKRLGMPIDIYEEKLEKYGIKPLGFTIHCNWYNTEYYKGTDTPQEFESEIVIYEDGKEVLKKVIEVNSPLKYKGITFYQSSYGMVPDSVGEFRMKLSSSTGAERTLRLYMGDTFESPGADIKGTIVDFSPALGRDPMTGELTTYSETMVNPAVLVKFEIGGEGDKGKSFTGWILKRYPDTGVLPGGHRIEFLEYWGVEYTGLQVSKDPGVVIIYFASFIMALGLYIAFFMSHKKLWIRLVPLASGNKKAVSLILGASASKNRLGFEKEVEKILSKMSQVIEK
jgi:cytochrome c biogenesis protein